MIYLWLKAAHVACVLLFVGGLIVQSLAVRAVDGTDAPVLRAIANWDRQVTLPTMLGTWLFGLIVAVQGAWFARTWLIVKLALVLVLSALHGLQAGRLRNAIDDL